MFINDFWIGLNGFEKALWGIAIPFTVFFILQLFATLSGISDDDEVGSDGDSASFLDFFTVRNIVSFFLGLSWGGIIFNEQGLSIFSSLFFGSLIGVGIVCANMFILKGLASLQSSGNLDLNRAVGTNATVSLEIPKSKESVGKISISVQ
jgi:hypothetical protein